MLPLMRQMRRLILSWQGELAAGGCRTEPALEASRAHSSDLDAALATLVADLVFAQSSSDRALHVPAQIPARMVPGTSSRFAPLAPEAARIAAGGRDPVLAGRLRSSVRGSLPVQELVRESIVPIIDEARGEHEAAATGFAAAHGREFGVPYEEAQALLGQGSCLVALGRVSDAVTPLSGARGIFAQLGAKPALEETDELMQQVPSA
ncbi:MAG: hypothetical protein WCP21_12805 [Armatimonadota bacterium]